MNILASSAIDKQKTFHGSVLLLINRIAGTGHDGNLLERLKSEALSGFGQEFNFEKI